MGRRHLTLEEATSSLQSGRRVEQWLGRRSGAAGDVVRWLELAPFDRRFRVTIYEVPDLRRADEFDVYAWVEEDPDRTSFVAQEDFATAAEAFGYAIESLGADAARFVNPGMIPDEYRDDRER